MSYHGKRTPFCHVPAVLLCHVVRSGDICLISPQAKVCKKSRLLKKKTDKMKNRSYRRTGCRNGRHVFRKLPTKFWKDCRNALNINNIQNSRFLSTIIFIWIDFRQVLLMTIGFIVRICFIRATKCKNRISSTSILCLIINCTIV